MHYERHDKQFGLVLFEYKHKSKDCEYKSDDQSTNNVWLDILLVFICYDNV